MEIEETEFVGADGSSWKHRVTRGVRYARTTYKDGTVVEISDLPPDFRAEQYGNDPLSDGRSHGRLWRIPEYLLERLFRAVESGGGNELIPRSIALLNENGETILELLDVAIYMMRSFDSRDIIVGYELTCEE